MNMLIYPVGLLVLILIKDKGFSYNKKEVEYVIMKMLQYWASLGKRKKAPKFRSLLPSIGSS